MRLSDDTAVGVLPAGLLDRSHVKIAPAESWFDAVVVPMKTATMFSALAMTGNDQPSGRVS